MSPPLIRGALEYLLQKKGRALEDLLQKKGMALEDLLQKYKNQLKEKYDYDISSIL